MSDHFQVLVIGSGPGGYVAAVRAAELGFKTACVEKMNTLGGTCLNVGCIPSKALLVSSQAYAWTALHSAEMGICVKEAIVDFAKMMKRKEDIVAGLVNGVASLFKDRGVERVQGEASFDNPHDVIVGERRLTADHIIIATGSQPISLPFLPFDEEHIVSSTGALALKSVPKKLLVIGAGVIGVELASVYARLGSAVTVVEMLDTITPAMDAAASRTLMQLLKKQGIEFYLGAKVNSASPNQQITVLSVEYDRKTLSLEGDIVLVAIGRRPFTQGLALEKAGITTTHKGFIPVDNTFRTTQPHIYAIGDVIEGVMLAHRASHEGIAAAELIAGKRPVIDYMSIPNVIYTHPEVAAVGLTETEAKSAGLRLCIGTGYFRGNGRARCNGDTDGFVKVIADETTQRILGMHIVGSDASELIAEGMLAIKKRCTLIDVASACHAHPTLSEVIMEASQAALQQKRMRT